jgi:hypothetical protein
MPGRKPRGEWTANSIDVGTRSTCALVLNDPVVAERHCALHLRDGRFHLEDLGSVTGTWCNGLAVIAPVELSDGDRIVVGVSRLVVKLVREGRRLELELAVEESSFHYKRAGPTNYQGPRDKWVVSDADRWVQSEVRFGRIGAVRALAWIAGALSVALSAWLLATKTGERWLQPEVLAGTHSDPTKIAECAACHSGGEPGRVKSCATCHGDILETRHPFVRGDGSDGDLAFAVPDSACLECHAGHRELDVEGVKSLARASLGRVIDGKLPPSCERCHPAPFAPDEDEMLARAFELAKRRGMDARAEEPHDYDFESFSHAKHVDVPGMKCAVCHAARPEAAATEPGGLEFEPVRFEHCAMCHLEKGAATPERFTALVAASRKLVDGGPGMLGDIWHGSDHGGCLECHAEAAPGSARKVSANLRQVEREVVAHTFAFRRRSHAADVVTGESPHACSECHDDPRSLDGGEQAEAAQFFHGAHVETLAPKSDTEAERLSRERCGQCHASQMSSSSVAQTTPVDFQTRCRACHGDAGGGSSGVPVAHAQPAERRRATEFSHAKHDQLPGGCFACHEFGASSSDDPLSVPSTRPGAADCTACHSAHRNIQGNACGYCHGADPNSRGDALLYRGEKFRRLDWPKSLRFTHFSNRDGVGHLTLLADESGAERCTDCHDAQNLSDAKTVSEVEIPDARNPRCLRCHAMGATWFHWSLPEAPK